MLLPVAAQLANSTCTSDTARLWGGKGRCNSFIPHSSHIRPPPHANLAPPSPFLDDLVGLLGHVVVADDVVQAGQGLVHVLLQPLQILRLLVHGDDGVLQLHEAALERRQDGHLARASGG